MKLGDAKAKALDVVVEVMNHNDRSAVEINTLRLEVARLILATQVAGAFDPSHVSQYTVAAGS